MRHILTILMTVALTISLAACDDFLNYLPSDATDATEAFQTVRDVENALTGTYYTLGRSQFYGRNVLALGDIAADNAWMNGASGHLARIYNYTISSDEPDLGDLWECGYKVIDRSTRLIQAGKNMLATDKRLNEQEKLRIQVCISQAYALKALSNFTLVNIFGLPYTEGNKETLGIVIVDEEPIAPSQKIQRSSLGETYKQILKEINLAKEHIDQATTNAFYFNPAAVAALEARVKLYMHDWQGAIEAAQRAIDKRGGGLVMNPTTYVAMWSDISLTNEDIFTIGKTVDDNLSANSLNTLYGAYGGKATSGLISLFAGKDMRLSLFGDGQGEQIRALKFIGLPASRATSNVPVFRLPEMYLIIAEAKAQLGQADAVDYVYETAKRNPELSKNAIPATKDELLQFISIERRRELFQEGHRWYDMRRTAERMTRVGGNSSIKDWDVSKFVYPIPVKEINASGIAQNENWNLNLPK